MKNLKIIFLFILIFNFYSHGQGLEQLQKEKDAVPLAKTEVEDSTYELKWVRFEGNSNIPSKFLESILRSKATPNWFFQFLFTFSSFGAPPNYFDPLAMESDVFTLQDFYNANGFFTATVTPKFQIDPQNKEASLTFIIDEKQPSTFGILRYFGLENYIPGYTWEIADRMQLDESNRYSQDVIQSLGNNLVTFLKTRGYLFSSYDSTLVVRDTIKLKADTDMHFTLGQRYLIDTVAVTTSGVGAEDVDIGLIRDLVKIQPDEYFDISKITNGQVRLYRTGLFDYVRVFPDTDSITGNRVPVKIDGIISEMNELGPEIIMNNTQNAFNFGLALEYSRKNFLGGARRLTVRGQGAYQDIFNLTLNRLFSIFTFSDTTSYSTFELTAGVTQPYFLNEPIVNTIEFQASAIKYGFVRSITYKAKINFEFELPKITFLNTLNAFYAVEDNIVSINFPSTIGIRTFEFFTAGVGAIASSSHVDNIIFPSTGHNMNILLEEGNLFPYLYSLAFTSEDIQNPFFLKTQLTAATYFPLSLTRDVVFAIKASVGYIQLFAGNEDLVPTNKQFYVGGSNSVRGWGPRAFPPLPEGEVVTDVNQIPGGNYLVEGSFEFRMRLGEYLGYAVFVDWGNTWKVLDQAKINQIAIASGFGVRFYTPIAAIRLDFGFKAFDPYNSTPFFKRQFFDLMQFHFGIGEAF